MWDSCTSVQPITCRSKEAKITLKKDTEEEVKKRRVNMERSTRTRKKTLDGLTAPRAHFPARSLFPEAVDVLPTEPKQGLDLTLRLE